MLPGHSYEPPEDGLPPQEVRIIDLRAEPWPEDRRRVRIRLEVTPFLERPNMEVIITDAQGDEISSINIIESIDTHLAFTMHIRGEQVELSYHLAASISYPDLGTVDQKRIVFETPEKENNSDLS